MQCTIEIIKKLSKEGKEYSVLRLTINEHELIDIYCTPRDLNKVLMAIINSERSNS